ncbi:MAG: ATP-binding cassette domain-containing protein [Pirellulaceae bacterium]|nr:ATP-binding cassette domain-containing protein [Pirellulaceae bacterium]
MMLDAIGIGRKAGDRWLFQDISFSVHAGDRSALVGPTGSGKTLLLRSLAMLDPLDTGGIRWQGEAVRGNEIPKFRSRVIYLQQRPPLVDGTVEDNLSQPFSLGAHQDKQFNRGRIVDLLESLGRGEPFLAKQQRDLSGGEAQLTALLRAIQLDPNILLLDEPTAALDAEAANMVETLVENWLNQQLDRRATVWVTHDHLQARRVSTSISQIRGGQLSGEEHERPR